MIILLGLMIHMFDYEGDDSMATSKDNLIKYLDKFKKECPDQIIIAETPNGTVWFKIGEALIYEGMGGEVVMDSE